MRIRIDPGEPEAILLAEELGADEIILDDLRGRREAERRKLQAIGTLGVLQAASRKKLLDLRKALELLRSASFYITEELLERLIAETKE
jgi:predicted nucleic acid-binding protein